MTTEDAQQEPSDQQQLAMERLHRITAVLAHELRNPLSVLQAGIELMADGDDDIGSLKKILQPQIQQITRLVADLSDMSRSADGKVRIDRRPIDVRPCLCDAIKSVEQVAGKRDQRIAIDILPDALWINGDPQRITQIIANLLSNASKYSYHGGKIEVSVAGLDDQFVEVRVRDYGIGIDAENLENVFEFFSQVATSESLEHADGGLGIGLGLVRTLVEMHGGNVWASSDGIGKGSEFVVQFPCCEPPAQAQDQPKSKPSVLPSRIMIVDDQRANVHMIKVLLKKLGNHELRCAVDAETALLKLGSFAPDIVLLDLGMPGMSGLELARKIRELPHCQTSLLVALTGYDDDGLRSEATAAGIDLYRIKPVSIHLLNEILEHPTRR